MNERRAAKRVSPDHPIAAKIKTSLPARLLDISVSGVQLELQTALRLHLPCELRLQIGGRETSLRAIVRRSRACGFGADETGQRCLLYRTGFEFIEPPAELIEAIRSEFGLDTAAPATACPEEEEAEIALALEGIGAEDGDRPGDSKPVRIRVHSKRRS